MASTSKGHPSGVGGNSNSSSPPEASVRAELERILANAPFVRSARLSRFLRFVVEETLKGGGRELKEYVLGLEVFDRNESFDPRTENIVRVEARRLRISLVEYYATIGSDDPISIELPKGTYTPVFRDRVLPAPARTPRLAVYKTKTIRWAAGLVLAAVAVYAVAEVTRSNRSSPTPPTSLAVLPFVNQTGNPELEFLCDGVTDEIINALARDGRLHVVARTSSFQFKGKSQNVREIGRQLNVGSVLEGSIRKVNDRLRITAQLIQVDSGYSWWSETYERDMQDVFLIQQEITNALARTLRGQPLHDQARIPTGGNVEAWILYQKGRYFWLKWTPEGAQKSIEYFEAAIAKSPEYALAHAGLADAWGVLGHWGVISPREASLKRDAGLARALELKPQLAEVRVPLAMKKAYYEWDWVGAEREFRRILESDPGSSEVFASFAVILQSMGRFEEARPITDRSLALDPLSHRSNLIPGWLSFHQGQYDSAIKVGMKVLEMDPNVPAAHTLIGRSYERKGQYPEAIQTLQRARSLAPGNTEITAALGYACARSGDRRRAEQLLADLHQLASRRRVSPADFAIIHLGLEQKEVALDYLEKGYQERDGRLVQLKVNPFYESLRGNPRFRNLLKKIGLDT